MAKIDCFSNEIQLSLNNIYSEIFEILGVDYQRSTSFGQDEPHRNPKKAYSNCAIGIYFMSFFYEHPVYINSGCRLKKQVACLKKGKHCTSEYVYYSYNTNTCTTNID